VLIQIGQLNTAFLMTRDHESPGDWLKALFRDSHYSFADGAVNTIGARNVGVTERSVSTGGDVDPGTPHYIGTID
jgi:hypothetical protein